jgi:hypothetical protein
MSKNKFFYLFQGPFSPQVLETVQFLKAQSGNERRFVLTTWYFEFKDADTALFDEVIISEDPGSECDDFLTEVSDNFNRQRYGVLRGMDNINAGYVIKLRTDVFFSSDFDINNFEQLLSSSKADYLVCASGSIDPEKFPILLHFSDLIVAGDVNAMKMLWNTADTCFQTLPKVDDCLRHFIFSLSGFRWARLACEQRLWSGQFNLNHFFFDKFSFEVLAFHNLLAKKIEIFNENEYGFLLPGRVSSDSSSAVHFYTARNPNHINKIKYVKTRFSPLYLARWIKSFLSVGFYFFLLVKRKL